MENKEAKNQKPISELMGITMEKVKEMVDINSIVGEPIKIDDEITIIPISKVSFGFASGGSDLPNKLSRDLFGGGAGAGVSIKPEGFLVINDGCVQMVPACASDSLAGSLIENAPNIVNKVGNFFKKNKNKDSLNIDDTDSVEFDG